MLHDDVFQAELSINFDTLPQIMFNPFVKSSLNTLVRYLQAHIRW